MTSLPPPIKPFERLHVTDGLLINADRWNLAHTYHRDRQNTYFQALHQPGIVRGLGVGVMSAPQEVPAQYRDGRWLQIQPGLAIDRRGNPIVVPQGMSFHISSTPLPGQSLPVYLVISYVDPDQLQRQSETDVVQETFRIDERQTPPDDLEVELCRILLSPEVTQLAPAANVFAPEPNQLDLRYRVTAQVRSPAMICAASLDAHPPLTQRLSWLLRSLSGFCPTLQGIPAVETVSLQDLSRSDSALLCLGDQPFRALDAPDLENLRQWLARGSSLLVEVGIKGTPVEELGTVQQELQAEIHRLSQRDGGASRLDGVEQQNLRRSLSTELQANQLALQQKTNALVQPFHLFAQHLGTRLIRWQDLDFSHPLRTTPFLFSALPLREQHPLQIFSGDGLMLVIGDLSAAWMPDPQQAIARDTIRTAQELGANLLHYAWCRQTLMQSQLSPT